MTDKSLKNKCIVDGLRANANMMPNIRANGYVGQEFKNIPGWLMSQIKRVISGKFVIILNPRRIETGLMPGASDMIGITEITITPDMIGKKIGLFTAIENKSKKDRWRTGQKEFLEMVADAGGIAGLLKDCDSGADYHWFSELTWPDNSSSH